MNITEALAVVQAGRPADDSDAALCDLIDAYRSIGGEIKLLGWSQDTAKQIISDIMLESGEIKVSTPMGSAAFTAASVRVSYDSKALDALIASDQSLARILGPHRKATMVAGGLTIKA